ncbi:mechanosensitive ion channel [Marinicella sp. S1101]|uniref:mechanosensitive ion channel family protein n=1 Tax=Marinicella marina TaxID=2996016 RepID=UPI002260E711|nr:mechanosensitive ion channel domain-containing protein [Marinicella marina]MCX7554176.1 mechanosensitive ion channel [Marinicella marina]MDJ1141131.1 mechanosensitive ion channel [Marinicella marina]
MYEALNNTAFTLSSGVMVTWLQIIYSLMFVVFAWFFSRLLAFILVRKLLTKTRISEDSKAIIQKILFFTMLVLVLLSVLTYLGIPLATFAFISGAVAIGFGFGAKNIIENFLSGWILMSERPIRMGDIIELDGFLGVVMGIGNRSTQIRRNDGAHIIVPNSQVLESRLVNWTLHDPFIRTSVRVGVAYGTDVELVRARMEAVLDSHELVQDFPQFVVVFEDFADNALVFDAFFWVSVQSGKELRIIRSEIRFMLEKAFREAGIVVAFPQRDVHVNFTNPIPKEES